MDGEERQECMSTSCSEREGVQGGSETSHVVRVGDCGSDEADMEVAELKMSRFSLRVTIMDTIRNEYIRGTAHMGQFGEKTREARLMWYVQGRRKDDGYIGSRLLRTEWSGERKLGRPKRRFRDVLYDIMIEVEVTEDDTEYRNNWILKIRCGDP